MKKEYNYLGFHQEDNFSLNTHNNEKSSKEVFSFQFEEIKSAKKPPNSQHSQTFCLISFWKTERNVEKSDAQIQNQQNFSENADFYKKEYQDHLCCYFEHKVDFPLLFRKKMGTKSELIPLELQDHIYSSECKTVIFFFSFDEENKTKVKFNTIKLDSKEIESCLVSEEASKLIIHYFQSNAHLSPPKLIRNCQSLAISNLNKENGGELTFFDTISWDVQFTIKHAISLLPDIEEILKEQGKGQTMFQSIWVLMETKIMKIKWPQDEKDSQYEEIKSFSIEGFKSKFYTSKKKRNQANKTRINSIYNQQPATPLQKQSGISNDSDFNQKDYVSCNQVEGYIHKGETRCTIIIKEVSWFSFELNPKKAKARTISVEDQHRDAVFMFDPEYPSQLKLLIGRESVTRDNGMIEISKKRFEDFFTMDIIDLNQEPCFQKNNYFISSEIDENAIIFKLSEDFKVPLHHLELSNFIKTKDNSYSSQAIFQDALKGSNHMFFLKGKLQNEQISARTVKALQVKDLVEIVNWELPKMRKFVSYPIVAYTNSDPSQRELMIINLAKDIPQKKLKFDFKILCFCETSQQLQLRELREDFQHENLIYFLALNTDLQVELYVLRCQIWSDKADDQFLLEKQSMKIDLKHYEIDKIKVAQVMMILKDDDLAHVLLIQFPEHIVSVDDKQTKQITTNDVDQTHMAQINMFSGILDRCYYIMRSRNEGDSLMTICTKKDIGRLDDQPVSLYKQKEKIIQIQIDHSRLSPFFDKNRGRVGGRFYVLDNTLQIRILEYDNKKRQMTEPQLVQKYALNLKDFSINRAIRALDKIYWSNCLINNKALITPRLHILKEDEQNQNETVQLVRRCFMYSTDSQSFYPAPMFQGQNKDSKLVCQDIDQINSIGKIILEVKEEQENYFLIMQNPTSKRVDFLNFLHQHKYNIQQYVLKDLVVIVFQKVEQKFLVFDQKTQMLLHIGEGEPKLIYNIQGDDPLILLNDCYQKFNEDGTLEQLYNYGDLKSCRDPSGFLECLELNKSHSCSRKIQAGYCMTSFYRNKAIVLKQLVKEKVKERFQQFDKSSTEQGMFKYDGQLKKNKSRIDENERNEEQKYFDSQEKGNIKICLLKIVDDNELADFEQIYFYVLGSNCKLFSDRNNQSERHLDSNRSNFDLLKTDKNLILRTLNVVWIIENDYLQTISNFDSPIKLEHNAKCKQIWLCDLFQGLETFLTGVTMHLVTKSDLNIVCNGEQQECEDSDEKENDVIQFTFLDLAIMWNLETNSEVVTLLRPNEFCQQIKYYTTTGFKYCNDFTHKEDQGNFMPYQEKAFLQVNEDRSLISTPATKHQVSVVFRQFSYHELKQIMFIEKFLKENKQKSVKINLINSSLLTVNIKGETFFSRFYNDVRLLSFAQKLIQIQGFEKDEDEVNDKIELRQIFYTLCLPFYQEENLEEDTKISRFQELIQSFSKKQQKDDKQKFLKPNQQKDQLGSFQSINQDKKRINKNNLVQWMVKLDKPEVEKIFRIVLLSSEITLSLLVQTFAQFTEIFKIQPELIDDFLLKALQPSSHCSNLTNMYWEEDLKMICFTANTGAYCSKKVQMETKNTILRKKSKVQKVFNNFLSFFVVETELSKLCKVRVVQIKWLNGNIEDFYKYLASEADNNPQIFDNELVKILLQEQNYTFEIFTKIFLPYMFYMILMLIYFLSYIPYDHGNKQGFFNPEYLIQSMIRCLATILFFILFYFEYKQIRFLGMEYWQDIWNYINLAQLFLNQFIIIAHSTDFFALSENDLVSLSSVACLILAFLLFYWMRLSSTMAFYVKMIMGTVYDLRQFIIFFLLVIMTFGCAFYLLDQYQESRYMLTDNYYLNVLKPQTSSSIVDAFINQYLLGLGDFYYAPFADSEFSNYYWFYFTMATFFTQIVFLNMLIAIMGDTFDRLTEKKSRNGLMQQTALYSDFMIFLEKNQSLDKNAFMYIITPVHSSELYENKEVWEGGYSRIKDAISAMEAKILDTNKRRTKEDSQTQKLLIGRMDDLKDQQREILYQLNIQSTQVRNTQEKKKQTNETSNEKVDTDNLNEIIFKKGAKQATSNKNIGLSPAQMSQQINVIRRQRSGTGSVNIDPMLFKNENYQLGSRDGALLSQMDSEIQRIEVNPNSFASPLSSPHGMNSPNQQLGSLSNTQEIEQLRERIASIDQQMHDRMRDLQKQREKQDRKISHIQARVQRMINSNSQARVISPLEHRSESD